MGILDELLGSQKDRNDSQKKTNIKIEYEFRPFRLRAKTENSVDLDITIENQSDQENLISVFVLVSKHLGFDRIAAAKRKEIRMGSFKPGEVKRLTVEIYGNHSTEEGEHKLKIVALQHYLDYEHIVDKFERLIKIRAV